MALASNSKERKMETGELKSRYNLQSHLGGCLYQRALLSSSLSLGSRSSCMLAVAGMVDSMILSLAALGGLQFSLPIFPKPTALSP